MLAPPEIESLFRQALRMHQQGSVTHAKAMYEEILAIATLRISTAVTCWAWPTSRPAHPSVRSDLISRALKINPESADAHYNLGHALRSLERDG